MAPSGSYPIISKVINAWRQAYMQNLTAGVKSPIDVFIFLHAIEWQKMNMRL